MSITTLAAAAHQRILDGVREALRRKRPEAQIESLDPARLRVHLSRDADYAAIYDTHYEEIVAAADDPVAFGRAWAKLELKLRYGGLDSPKPEQPQSMVWEKALVAYQWQPEIPALFNDLGGLVRPGQKITFLDWWMIEVDGVAHTHEEVRRRAGGREPIILRSEVERQARNLPEIREMLRRSDARRK